VRVPDANVLLYASDSSSSHHSTARGWIERALSGTETVGFALVVLLAFVRIATNPRVMATPMGISDAFDQVEEWLAQPPATAMHPGRRHLGIWRELLEASGAAGNLTSDAHLAALAIEHGAVLASFDGDFHRFAGLELEYLR
jgi:uncharacterized protein